MKYILTKNGTLYAYDAEKTGFTFVFKQNKWRVAEVVYGALINEEGNQIITETEANQKANGISIETALNKVKDIMGLSI